MAAHNPEVEGSNPSPATNHHQGVRHIRRAPFWFSGDQMLTSCSRRPVCESGSCFPLWLRLPADRFGTRLRVLGDSGSGRCVTVAG